MLVAGLLAFGTATANDAKEKIRAQDLAARARMTDQPVTMVPVSEIAKTGDISRSATLTPDVLLYDQTSSINANATSQNFEAANDAFDNQAGDDFVVPGSGWQVQSVFIPGVYSATHGTPTSMRVTFFADAAGSPGAVICDFPTLAFVEAPVGSFTITLPGAGCALTGGTKWISAVANLDFAGGAGGQWFWSTRTLLAGNPSQWQNPGAGFGTPCTTWGVRTTCLAGQTDPDMAFSLSGVVSACTIDADCQDGNLCNGAETCAASVCQPGTPVNCDDSDVCTIDGCTLATGECTHVANSCNDGNACTRDLCVAGVGCQNTNTSLEFCSAAGAIPIPGSGNATPYPSVISVSGLHPSANLCAVKLNGITHTFPDDLDMLLAGPLGGASNAIIMSDVGGGTDAVGVNLVLSDSAATAIPDGGPLVNGTFRPNNAAGTGGEVWSAPAPAPSGAVALSTFNNSNPNGDWSLFVVDDEAGDSGALTGWCVDILELICVVDADCNDGNACNGIETCQPGGICAGGTPVNCNDDNVCTTDTCDTGTGVCTNAPNACDDFDLCTDDSCDPQTGCAHANFCVQFCSESGIVIPDPPLTASPYPSTVNVTGMSATSILSSVRIGGLTHSFPDDINMLLVGPSGGSQNATIFSDVGGGTPATNVTLRLTDVAPSSIPNGGPLVSGVFKPTDVNDDTDTFPAPAPTPAGGSALSVFTGNPNGNWGLFIVDEASGDTGTIVVWCLDVRPGGCSQASDCDDVNPCTDDACVSGNCQYTNNDTNTCSDNDACTTDDFCIDGFCIPGTPADCDDLNVCTSDACNPGTGCTHGNVAGACSDGDPCTSGDTCAAGVCQPGAPNPAPGEVSGVGYQTDKDTLSWTSTLSATQYDVVRGSVAALPVGPGGGDEVCFADIGTTSLVDATNPALGSSNWYLVRGENACGSGGYGNATGPTPRTTTTCP